MLFFTKINFSVLLPNIVKCSQIVENGIIKVVALLIGEIE